MKYYRNHKSVPWSGIYAAENAKILAQLDHAIFINSIDKYKSKDSVLSFEGYV